MAKYCFTDYLSLVFGVHHWLLQKRDLLWDQALNEALDSGVPISFEHSANNEDSPKKYCVCVIGEAAVWIYNRSYPEGYGKYWRGLGQNSHVPRRLTIIKLRRLVEAALREQYPEQYPSTRERLRRLFGKKPQKNDSEKLNYYRAKLVGEQRASFLQLAE